MNDDDGDTSRDQTVTSAKHHQSMTSSDLISSQTGLVAVMAI